jgi:hypothetical protein
MNNCDHRCTGNCRRVGCNCECGEWHEEQTTSSDIADYIEERMESVDPMLLQKFVWIIRDGIECEKGVVYLATTNWLNPPLVIFYPDAMATTSQTKEQIDHTIRHEIIHACFRGDEHQAYGMKEINVFI